MPSPPPVVIPALAGQTASFIFLHGLGDTGNGWAPVMRMIKNALPTVKFILPHAPKQPVTMNNNMVMNAWYDIYSLDGTRKDYDVAGISKSVNVVRELIDQEAGPVFVGGFSQGGVVALSALLAGVSNLAGVVALSSYIPDGTLFGANKDVPIFIGHGHDDPLVPVKWGQNAADRLKAAGYGSVLFRTYPEVQHSASDKELDDMVSFIKGILEKSNEKSDL